MSKLTTTVHVEAPSDQVLGDCRQALRGLGWEVHDHADGGIVAREDATRLCCRESPVSARLQMEPLDAKATAVEITASVPGFGPISSRAVRTRLALMQRVLLRPDFSAPG